MEPVRPGLPLLALAALATSWPTVARAGEGNTGDTNEAEAGRAVPPPRGSIITAEPLGKNNKGMSLGAGLAVVLPYYLFEFGYGVSRNVDLLARYETIIGVMHYPRLGVHLSPLRLGRWRGGLRLWGSYFFFGLRTTQLDLTSKLTLGQELAVSGPIGPRTRLFFTGGGQFDLFTYEDIEGEAQLEQRLDYGAGLVSLGMQTPLAPRLDIYVRARVTIPTKPLTAPTRTFYVLPFLEVGGVFGW